MRVASWVVRQAATPMVLELREDRPAAGEVLVEIAGCGVCHTDLGFFYEGIPTRRPFPLTLGHEISGHVVDAGEGAREWLNRAVVVPAVLPCGACAACEAGRGQVCPRQVFLGSDVDGGFASHVRVPARGLCPVPDLGDPARNRAGLDLSALSVVADAVSTPYQAIVRNGVQPGDFAVFVGAGGIGGFGVQIAAALGAVVAALDIDDARLDAMARHGASFTLNPAGIDAKQVRRQVRAFAETRDIPTWRTHIFETSGSAAGQVTAFGLLGHGSQLSVVGYTPKPIEVRLSNLMAFDATARGNWGCLPEHYPAVVDLVLDGRVVLAPFVERRPLATINDAFEEVHAGRASRRIILVPER